MTTQAIARRRRLRGLHPKRTGEELQPKRLPEYLEADEGVTIAPSPWRWVEVAVTCVIPFHPDCAMNAGYKLCIVIPSKVGTPQGSPLGNPVNPARKTWRHHYGLV